MAVTKHRLHHDNRSLAAVDDIAILSPPEQSRLQSFDFTVFFRYLAKTAWWAIPIILVVAIGMFFLLKQQTPIYPASAKVLISLSKLNPSDVKGITEDESIRTDLGSHVSTQIELIRSSSSIEAVVDKLGLIDDLPAPEPRFTWLASLEWFEWRDLVEATGLEGLIGASSDDEEAPLGRDAEIQKFAQLLREELSVTPANDSSVIDISIAMDSPETANSFVNALAAEYVRRSVALIELNTETAKSFLDERLEKLEENLEEARAAVVTFERENPVVSPAGIESIENQIGSLEGRLNEEALRIEDLTNRLAEIEGGLASSTDIGATSALVNSPRISDLRQQWLVSVRRLSELREELGPNHPQMVDARKSFNSVNQLLRSEIEQIAKKVERELSIAEKNRDGIQETIADLRARYEDSREKISEQQAINTQFNIADSLYTRFLNRMIELDQVAPPQASSRILTAAKGVPDSQFKYSPKLGAAGTFFSLMFGYLAIAAFLSSRGETVSEIDDLRSLLGTRHVAATPKLPAKWAGKAHDKTWPHHYMLTKPGSFYSQSIVKIHDEIDNLARFESGGEDIGKVVMVTSSIPLEGKSSLTLCIVTAGFMHSQRVLLIDTDFWRSGALRMAKEPRYDVNTLADYLEDACSFSDLVDSLQSDGSEASILISTRHAFSPDDERNLTISTRERRRKMEQLIQWARRNYDLVLVDTPPVFAPFDTLDMLPSIDLLVFLMRWNQTERNLVKAAADQLHKRFDGQILGVMSMVETDYLSRSKAAKVGVAYHYVSDYYG